jgi:outer membrane protein OmpA-like peptidoglycan-associated protein
VPIILTLANYGCATRRYARKQADVVNQRVSEIQTQTNEQLAKHQGEISRLDERATTTENQLVAVSNTAQQASAQATQASAAAAMASSAAAQANNTAGQALQASQGNDSKISAQSSMLLKLENAQNYTLAETGNVIFGFNKSDLSNDAKVALDLIAQKALAQPRTILEIVGFTDEVGSASYNLALSQKRAETVARYLVRQNVPLKNVTMIGLGEEQTPALLSAEVQGFDPNAGPAEIRSLARRVRIRLYTPGEGTTAAAGGGAPVAKRQ